MSSSTLGQRLSCRGLKQSLLLHVHLDGMRVETESSPAGDSWSLITTDRFLEAQASSGHTHESISVCPNCRSHHCSLAGKDISVPMTKVSPPLPACALSRESLGQRNVDAKVSSL